MSISSRPIVWTIAGSDAGGGAGIQADLRTIEMLGGHGCTLITCLTAQNSISVNALEATSSAMFSAQLDCLWQDLPPVAIKIGLLANAEQVQQLAAWLAQLPEPRPPVIYDPVLNASCGAALADAALPQAICQHLLPYISLLTPNSDELALLTGMAVDDDASAIAAGRKLQQLGCRSLLLKAGHSDWQGAECRDLWLDDEQVWVLARPRLMDAQSHGSGCVLASAIATLVARGETLADALVLAAACLQQGLSQVQMLGQGPGPLRISGWPSRAELFPRVYRWQQPPLALAFATTASPLGLYPVVDSCDWLELLLRQGVRTLQLRIKTATADLEAQVQRAVALGRTYRARIFINDHWQLALRHGAYGVHLGQEDVDTADLAAIAAAGLRLGLSTHGYFELCRALALRPSYVALGHIFATQTKQMPSRPQGLARLRQQLPLCGLTPTVAIGGISLERAAAVQACGVGGVALVSAITQAADPALACSQLLAQLGNGGELAASAPPAVLAMGGTYADLG